MAQTQAQREQSLKLAKTQREKAIFKTPDELLEKYEAYLKDQDDVFKTRPPSFSRFADWCGIARRTMYKYFGKWPGADDTIRRMTADILFEHTVTADYRDAPGIFGLKNIAGWTDKKETITHDKRGDIATPEEAKEGIHKIIDSLGGMRSQGRIAAKAKKPLEEVQNRMIELEEMKTG